jgi:hypothetical protein
MRQRLELERSAGDQSAMAGWAGDLAGEHAREPAALRQVQGGGQAFGFARVPHEVPVDVQGDVLFAGRSSTASVKRCWR